MPAANPVVAIAAAPFAGEAGFLPRQAMLQWPGMIRLSPLLAPLPALFEKPRATRPVGFVLDRVNRVNSVTLRHMTSEASA